MSSTRMSRILGRLGSGCASCAAWASCASALPRATSPSAAAPSDVTTWRRLIRRKEVCDIAISSLIRGIDYSNILSVLSQQNQCTLFSRKRDENSRAVVKPDRPAFALSPRADDLDILGQDIGAAIGGPVIAGPERGQLLFEQVSARLGEPVSQHTPLYYAATQRWRTKPPILGIAAGQ